MVKNVIAVWKPAGWTPLQCVSAFINGDPKYKSTKISYAGRLDPMAEGVVLLLIGDENKKRKKYEDLKKGYLVEVLFGVTTDTYDALGIPSKHSQGGYPSHEEIRGALRLQLGEKSQKYPPYSSKPIRGKPLFWWARQGKLNDIIIPEKTVTIFSAEAKNNHLVEGNSLFEEVSSRIARVKGDFRQKEILEKWAVFFKENNKPFLKVTLIVHCSSGTYMRSLANSLGEMLGCGAIALSIVRTEVGSFTEKDCLQLVGIS